MRTQNLRLLRNSNHPNLNGNASVAGQTWTLDKVECRRYSSSSDCLCLASPYAFAFGLKNLRDAFWTLVLHFRSRMHPAIIKTSAYFKHVEPGKRLFDRVTPQS